MYEQSYSTVYNSPTCLSHYTRIMLKSCKVGCVLLCYHLDLVSQPFAVLLFPNLKEFFILVICWHTGEEPT